VVVQTHQLVTVQQKRTNILTWCEQCNAQVAMVRPESAAEIARVTQRTIYRRVERGDLHFLETSAGELFICCASLQSGLANRSQTH